MAPPVKLTRLAGFSDGTAHGIRSVVEMFLADTGETLEALRGAIESGDARAIEMLAHRAGGASGACGAERLSALLFEMREGSRSFVGDRALFHHISLELEAVAGFLQNYTATLDASAAGLRPAAFGTTERP